MIDFSGTISRYPNLARATAIVLLMLSIGAIFQSLAPAFLSANNLKGILRAMSISGITAIGLTFVIIVKKFDLSLPGIGSLCAMTLGYALSVTGNVAAAIFACVGMGILFGLFNGLLIGRFKLPDVVATIAIGSIAGGAAFIYNSGATFSDNFFSSGFVTINFKTFLGMQIPVAILFGVALFLGLILTITRFGQSLYSVGENETASKYSGLSVPLITCFAFMICGATVGLSMTLHVAGAGSAFVTAGSQLLLPAYTSVFLGAALLGRASVPGTFIGSLITTSMLNGFNLLSVPYYTSDIVISSVLLASIAIFDPAAFNRARDFFRKIGLFNNKNVRNAQ